MKQENLEACPVCAHQEFITYLQTRDFVVSNEKFTICKCKHCSFLFTSPRPDVSNIGRYYESDDYISHTDASNNFINKIYKIARYFTLAQKRQIVANGFHQPHLLDYGCGTGGFLKVCQKKEWFVKGIEPNLQARSIALSQQIAVHESLQNLNKHDRFDIITIWHVLEHIHDLNDTFAHLKTLLTTNGRMYIAVPNHLSKDAATYKQYWAAYDLPRHLYHFNQTSMEYFLGKHKMKLIKKIPMPLDAFYVAMLSEKYKKRPLGMIKSIINACISNIYGFFNQNNYSSIIYVASK